MSLGALWCFLERSGGELLPNLWKTKENLRKMMQMMEILVNQTKRIIIVVFSTITRILLVVSQGDTFPGNLSLGDTFPGNLFNY